MAITTAVTATAQEITVSVSSRKTLYNAGANTIYGRRGSTTTGFAGDAAALDALAEFKIAAGKSIAFDQSTGPSLVVACATGLESSLEVSIGGVPFEQTSSSAAEIDAAAAGYAILSGVTGSGTEASPYVSADNTGGFGAVITALTAGRGGRISVPPAAFTISSPVTITQDAVAIVGDAAGFNEDPNGEHEGICGTKIICAAEPAAFVTGKHAARPGGDERPGNSRFTDLYFWGGDKTHNAIKVVGADQAQILDCNFGGLNAAVIGANDAMRWRGGTVLGCTYGWKSDIGGAWTVFPSFSGICFADLDKQALAFYYSATEAINKYASVIGNIFVRCCKTAGEPNDRAAVLLNTFRAIVSNNHILSTSNATAGEGWGIISGRDDCLITGNFFADNYTGDIQLVNSDGWQIVNNHYQNRGTGSRIALSGNATGNTIFEPSLVDSDISDISSGVNTKITRTAFRRKLAITFTAEAAHARTVTIQVNDIRGDTAVAAIHAIPFHFATAANGAPAAMTNQTVNVTAGTLVVDGATGGQYKAYTDATGKITLTYSHSGAAINRYLVADLDSVVFSSAVIAMD